jgi:hypothetical protein
VITTLLRLWFAFSAPHHADLWHDSMAHHACEVIVYGLVSPETRDDATTLLGETTATLWCRYDVEPPFHATHGASF